MGYSLTDKGHLDLSSCFMHMSYDMFAVCNLSYEYYFSEMTDLVAWDGLPVTGMRSENKWRHLVCKHKRDRLPFNAISDLDLKRIELLPLAKEVIAGRRDIDIYEQQKRGKTDKIQIIISGADINYLVCLGYFGDYYILRSAYPAGQRYISDKVIKQGHLVEEIRT